MNSMIFSFRPICTAVSALAASKGNNNYYYYWQSVDVTSLFDGDYYYSVTAKVTDMSLHVRASQPPPTGHPRLATVCQVAIENKEYLGKLHASFKMSRHVAFEAAETECTNLHK